jgi:hypothetical protein
MQSSMARLLTLFSGNLPPYKRSDFSRMEAGLPQLDDETVSFLDDPTTTLVTTTPPATTTTPNLNDGTGLPLRKSPLEPKLFDEIVACMEILERSRAQHQADYLAKRRKIQNYLTLRWLATVGVTIASPAVTLKLMIAMSQRLYNNLLPGWKASLQASMNTYNSYSKNIAEKGMASYYGQLFHLEHDLEKDKQQWLGSVAYDAENYDCDDGYYSRADNCQCWHDDQNQVHDFDRFLARTRGWEYACMYLSDTFRSDECKKIMVDACEIENKIDALDKEYEPIFKQRWLLDDLSKAIEDLKSRISGKTLTVEPWSTAVFVLTTVGAVASLCYYAKSYYNVHQEYKEDQDEIIKNDPVEFLIRDAAEAERFINLSARLGVQLKSTSVSVWLKCLEQYILSKEFAEYIDVKAAQKALFQTPFFRHLVPDMQRVLAKEFVTNPETPSLKMTK